jgi:hypothetical protein
MTEYLIINKSDFIKPKKENIFVQNMLKKFLTNRSFAFCHFEKRTNSSSGHGETGPVELINND